MTDLAIYNEMTAAIDRCYRVDELKDLRDRAMALEYYARQAQNVENERKAAEVRIRAERRAGVLLKEMEKTPGARTDLTSSHDGERLSEYQQATQEANISKHQAERWQKLAEMPREDFEGRLQNPLIKPTTTGILNGNLPKQAPDDALWLWGRLRDFEREYISQKSINEIVSEMSDALQSDVRRIVPQLLEWLGDLER